MRFSAFFEESGDLRHGAGASNAIGGDRTDEGPIAWMSDSFRSAFDVMDGNAVAATARFLRAWG